MKTRRIIGLGLIASALADLVAIGYGAGKSFPHAALVIGYALLFAQASAGAIWLGIGSNAVLLRLVAHLALLTVLFLGLSMLHDNQGQWLQLLAVQSLAITGPLAVSRGYGLRLQQGSSAANRNLGNSRSSTSSCSRPSVPWYLV